MKKLFALLCSVAFLLNTWAVPQDIVGGHRRTGPANTNPFPSSIANLALRFEADCITFTSSVCGTPSDGTTITAWADESGNSNDAGSGTGTCTFHTNQINTNPAVTFANCSLALTTGIVLQNTNGSTGFFVFKDTQNSSSPIISGSFKGISYYANYGGTNLQGVQEEAAIDLGHGTAASNTTNWHQTDYALASGTGVNGTYRQAQSTDTTVGGTGQDGSTASTSTIGHDVGNAVYFAGQIAAIIIYQRQLNSTEIGQVETYLHTKYGV